MNRQQQGFRRVVRAMRHASKMTAAEFDILDGIAWMEGIGGTAIMTNRNLRKRDGDRCVAKGWAIRGCYARMDDDGGIREPEQWGPGYEFTDAGRAAYAAKRAAIKKASGT